MQCLWFVTDNFHRFTEVLFSLWIEGFAVFWIGAAQCGQNLLSSRFFKNPVPGWRQLGRGGSRHLSYPKELKNVACSEAPGRPGVSSAAVDPRAQRKRAELLRHSPALSEPQGSGTFTSLTQKGRRAEVQRFFWFKIRYAAFRPTFSFQIGSYLIL